MSHHVAAGKLLGHLGLDREPPTIDYLNRLITAHQRRVPFETLTKLTDFEPGRQRGDFMPTMTDYVDRIVRRGAGGLCWTLARGCQVLLADLGFDAALMYMDPGHCCVRVELPEGPFYADVGYAAPLYQAYPLFESFSVDTHREKFEYRVGADGIVVTRRPGPSKTLDPTPRRLEELRDHIAAANDWTNPQSFLYHLVYARDVDGVYTTLRDQTLTRYLPGGAEKTIVSIQEAPSIVHQVFAADPALYVEAAAVHARYSGSVTA